MRKVIIHCFTDVLSRNLQETQFLSETCVFINYISMENTM